MADILPPGAPAYVLHGLMFHCQMEAECDTLESAFEAVYWANADGTWNPERLFNTAGELIMESPELFDRACKHVEEQRQMRRATP